MGIDIQGFKHLLYCKQYGSFKDTLTNGIYISLTKGNNICMA